MSTESQASTSASTLSSLSSGSTLGSVPIISSSFTSSEDDD